MPPPETIPINYLVLSAKMSPKSTTLFSGEIRKSELEVMDEPAARLRRE
jgi:hypothetical protein